MSDIFIFLFYENFCPLFHMSSYKYPYFHISYKPREKKGKLGVMSAPWQRESFFSLFFD